MKKSFLFALALLLLAGLAACDGKNEPETSPSTTMTTEIATEITIETTTATTQLTTTTQATTIQATTTGTSANAIVTATTTTSSRPTAQPGGSYAYNYPGITPVVATVPADPYLICVNRNYHLPANYTPALRVCVESYPEKIQMEATAAAQYRKMYDAALAGGAELIPYSGYRSDARQKTNFDRLVQTNVDRGYSYAQAVNIAAQSILPPGCSEHAAGLAMDIVSTSTGFDTTKEFAWLTAHAHEYGFILRYPKDKTSITQITYEPWHWRYVGVGPATAMKASGQCLEEYLGLA